jgi:phage tail sheath gpL-like
MATPTAVSPTVKTPGFYLTLNLLAGVSSPGTAPLRCLLMAPKSSAGTITADTQLERAVSGADAVKTLLGTGTPGHLTAVALFRAYGLALVDVISPAASAGVTATGTITFDDTTPVTVAQTVTATIKGEEIVVTWLVGETDIQAATKLVTAINAATALLPVTAANGGGTLAAITLSAKIPGPWGNDVLYNCLLSDGTGGSVTPSSMTAQASGATEPSFATALSTVSNREYDFILACVSNADAQSSSTTSNPGRVKTHIDTYDSGAQAKLQQAVIGASGTLASTQTGAIGRNFGPMQYVLCVAGQSLGCEWAGWEVGRRLRLEVDDPAVNRIGEAIDGLFGAYDLVGDKPTDTEVETALSNGISIINYDAQDDPFMVRPITTYSQDSVGNPDVRLLDVSGVSGTFAFAKDLRTSVPQNFAGAKISRDLADNDEPLPKGVVEERDIKAFITTRGNIFVSRGVLRRDLFNEAIEDGTLSVVVDDTDETQVNAFIPVAIVKPLAKIGTYVARTA